MATRHLAQPARKTTIASAVCFRRRDRSRPFSRQYRRTSGPRQFYLRKTFRPIQPPIHQKYQIYQHPYNNISTLQEDFPAQTNLPQIRSASSTSKPRPGRSQGHWSHDMTIPHGCGEESFGYSVGSTGVTSRGTNRRRSMMV